MAETNDFQAFSLEFAQYIKDLGLFEQESLEILKNLKIAIHGGFLIHNIIKNSNLNLFHGFSKFHISRYIKKLLDKFKQYSIRCVIVFDGIVFTKDNKTSNFQDITEKIKSAWQSIKKDRNDPNVYQILNEIAKYYFCDHELIKSLEDLDIEYIHAPYFAANQIKFFVDYHYTHFAVCGLESFTHGFNHIIVDFNFEKDQFIWVDQKKMMKAIGFDGLKEPKNAISTLFLVKGYNPNHHLYIPIEVDKLVDDANPQSKTYSFDDLRKKVAGNTAINNLLGNDDAIGIYHSLRKKLEFSLVFNSDCDVDLMTSSKAYESLNEYFGPYFPNEVYIFSVFNILDRELIDSIANGHFVIKPPLADSTEYHHHLENTFKLCIEKIIGILASKLNQKYKKDLYFLSRFGSDKPIPLVPREYKAPKFLIKQELIDKDPKKSVRKISFVKILQYFSEITKERNSKGDQAEQKKLVANRKESLDFELSSPLRKRKSSEENPQSVNMKKVNETLQGEEKKTSEQEIKSGQDLGQISDRPTTQEEMLAYVYLSFLEMYDHVDIQNITLMILGAGLRKCHEGFEETLIILLELMKPNLCLVNDRELNNPRSRKQSSDILNSPEKKDPKDRELVEISVWKNDIDEENRGLILLISRIFCLISSSTYPNQKSTKFDYELCQYLTILNNVQKMLRFTFDSLLLSTFLSYGNKKDLKSLFELKKSLPFRQNINISLGIAIKQLLQTKESFAEFKQNNPQFVNLEHDLMSGYTLFSNIHFLLRYQASSGGEFNVGLLDLFKKAGQLLDIKFREFKLLDAVKE